MTAWTKMAYEAFHRNHPREIDALRAAVSRAASFEGVPFGLHPRSRATGYPCCRGLDAEDLLAEIENPALRELIAALLEHSPLAPLVPASVVAAATGCFAEPLIDVEDALHEFLGRVSDGLGGPEGSASIEYVLFGFGAGSRLAREALRGAHDAAFHAFVDAASQSGLTSTCSDPHDGLYVGLRDLGYDGLRAYLVVWLWEPRGERAERARALLAAGMADLITSRTVRRLPDELTVLERRAADGLRGLRLPFTPFSVSRALSFVHRVMFRSMAEE